VCQWQTAFTFPWNYRRQIEFETARSIFAVVLLFFGAPNVPNVTFASGTKLFQYLPGSLYAGK